MTEALAARRSSYLWELLRRRELTSAALGPKARLLEVTGVHHADGAPLAFERRLVNLAEVHAIAAADLSAEAPDTWLLAHAPWTQAEHRITATSADKALARALGCAAGGACLTVHRRTWRGETPVTSVEQSFAPGRHELVARFGARE